MNYFEYQEGRTQRSVSLDVVDWPDVVVTEASAPEGKRWAMLDGIYCLVDDQWRVWEVR